MSNSRPMAHEIIWRMTGGKPWLFVHGRYFDRHPSALLVPTNQYMKRVWKEFRAKQDPLKGSVIS